MSRPAYQRGRQGGRAGQWVAVADLGWREGKRDRREFTAATKRGAEEKRDAFLHKRRDGFTLPKGRPLYVAEWLEHWLSHVAKPNVEPTTWYRFYRPVIEDRCVPFFARIRLPDLAKEDVEAWHAWLSRQKGRHGGLSAVTIIKAHGVLSAALKEAVARDLLPRNPCAGVRMPRSATPEIAPPDRGQVLAILEACRERPGGARWVLAITTGLRQGEALALRWRDVRLDGPKPSLTVARSRARLKGEWVVKQPKTAKGRRSFPLPKRALAALRAHRAAQTVTSLDGLVFTTRAGQPVHGKADWADWQALLASLGLPRWRVHDLRHAYAVLLLEQGVDVRVVQEMMGHSRAAVTQDVYQHVSEGLKDLAVEAIDRALGD